MHRADRRTVLRLAALADVDPRTARRALLEGPEAVKGRAGEKLADAIATLAAETSAASPSRSAA